MTRLVASLCALLAASPALAAETSDFEPPEREYKLVFAPAHDLHMVSTASPTLNRVAQDAYLYGIGPHLPPVLDTVLGTTWSAFFTYTTMLWPHEFGHWSRAQQVDSRFIFHDVMPLLPHTTVEMPDDASHADSALLTVGGFEVNSLVARQVQLDFYQRGGAWSDELAHGLLNEMFFPIYAGIFPAKAKEAATWTETRGDPVHIMLPVYERHAGRPPVDADGEVDPDLTRLYRQAVLFSLVWTALDPGLIQQGMAFTDGSFDARQAWMPIRTERFGWTWGTQFNPSPLGYELYLLQYLQVDQRSFEVAVKYGRPMKNNGIRVSAPDIVENDRIRLGAEVEVWDQDVYDLGVSATATAEASVHGGLGVVGWLGYKTEGYVMGRDIDRTPFGAVGLTYRFHHGPRPADASGSTSE